MEHRATNRSPGRRPIDGGDSTVGSNSESSRLTAIEAAIVGIRHTLDIQFQRIAAIQAQLDHMTAKSRDR
jgi:hypothetical protein